MEPLILLGLLVILAAIRREIRAVRVARRRRRALAARAPAALPPATPAIVVAALLAMLLLTGCPMAGNTKTDLPKSTLVAPRIVYVDRYRYVPIRAELVQPEPIAEGPLAQCPMVAADRKAALLRANAKLTQIGAVQGSEAKP